MKFVYVALGGAFGAMARYALSLIPVKSDFPILTLVTNILGAILIGFIVGIAEAKNGVSDEAMLFLKTGVCGGFTTFSTFSLEAANMFDEKRAFAGCKKLKVVNIKSKRLKTVGKKAFYKKAKKIKFKFPKGKKKVYRALLIKAKCVEKN